jgi:hypothetical protein
MKNSMWMVGLLVVAFFQASCSKSKGPSPEDTSLIKGTDRGTFMVMMNCLLLVRPYLGSMEKIVFSRKIHSGAILMR